MTKAKKKVVLAIPGLCRGSSPAAADAKKRGFWPYDRTVAGIEAIDYLKADPERILILSNSHFTCLHNIVSIQDHIVKMTAYPEDIIFIDR